MLRKHANGKRCTSGGGEAPGGNSVTIEVSVEANNNGAGNGT